MQPEQYKRYYQILEVGEQASLEEVTQAYLHLKKLYSHSTAETIPVEAEFLSRERSEILKQLDEAYGHLKALYRIPPNGEEKGEGEKEDPLTVPIIPFSGPFLQQLRQAGGVELGDISRDTRISTTILKHLEAEDFKYLPPAVYIRGYIGQFARCLGLNPQEVVAGYMARYEKWQQEKG